MRQAFGVGFYPHLLVAHVVHVLVGGIAGLLFLVAFEDTFAAPVELRFQFGVAFLKHGVC
jgi:hypothetical protein